jgi:phosphopantetheine--protein transferase-like protein
MEEKIKDIIAGFIRVPAEQISVDTVIDRTSVSSSITLHRMYAKLAEEGIVVEDYSGIKKFGTLLQKIKGNVNGSVAEIQNIAANSNFLLTGSYETGRGVGIDIEEVDSMPKTNDFREDEFYKMNFSSSEIAYCILQSAPYASFAGLFAAKEAIVKADNSIKNKPFNAIVINHEPEGKPVYAGFNLSISHTNSIAIAIAVQMGADVRKADTNSEILQESSAKPGIGIWLLLAASVLISLVALFVAFKR